MKTRFAQFSICLIILISMSGTVLILADSGNVETDPVQKSILFLLDASGSMQNNDPDRLAIDSIAQLIYSLPSNYRVGFIAYNTEVTASQPFLENDRRALIMKTANEVIYSGYTNAGAGLEQAMKLLKKEDSAEQSIVILSDGEIFMTDDVKTEESVQQFQKMRKQAKKQGIKIHVIGLGKEMEDSVGNIFSAAKVTGGGSYHAPFAVDIQQAIDSILKLQLQIKRTTAAVIESNGETEKLTIRLPEYAYKARILLTANAEIKNLKTDLSAADAKQFNGERYSLIEISKPSTTEAKISFQGQPGSQIKVELITEYQVMPQIETSYTDAVPAGTTSKKYERTAHIKVNYKDAQNQSIPVLADELFQFEKIKMSVNGEDITLSLMEGSLSFDYPSPVDEQLTVGFDFSELPTNILSGFKTEIQLSGAPALPTPVPLPPPVPEPNYTPVFIAGGVGLILIILVITLLILRKRRRQRPLPMPEEAIPAPSKFSYTGKLNIYISKTPSGYDIPPLSFSLFRLSPNRVLSLGDILKECNVEEAMEGANKIFFKSGANRSLILTNSSDCTIMRSREILMKNRSYSLTIDAKLDIAFEDEYSELTLHYKDLKPSEMRASAL